METLFSLINILVAPFWLMMIFLPGARVTGQLMRWQAVILGPVIVYIILIAPDLMHIVPLLLSLGAPVTCADVAIRNSHFACVGPRPRLVGAALPLLGNDQW